MKITKLIKDVAKLKGFYVKECNDNFNLGRNFIIGRNEENNVQYFETIREIEFFLGILKEDIVDKDDKTYLVETKYTFAEIKKAYEESLV